MQKQDRTLLFDEKKIAGAIDKVAKAICSDFSKEELSEIAFLGIQLKGLPFARRIIASVKKSTNMEIPLGRLDISMYRDDIGMRKTLPQIHETDIPFDINNRTIILVDDVLHTGRTIRAALDAITDYGRPAMIKLAVLVDRGMKEFPIQADYVGQTHHVSGKDHVSVSWKEFEGRDAVYLTQNK
ncbi:MAG: bifunctional pyr operon transcriptional regulator/uracil phosphoribosyltransferase PyrR [Victivallales bacterium]